MRRALALALIAGCSYGGSTSVVGRWRARRIVDSTACVQNDAPGGGCEKLIEIGRDIPARRFSTTTFTFAAPGYMQERTAGGSKHGVTLFSTFEYLRGRGGLAVGARLGGTFSNGFGDRLFFTMPLSLVAHAGGLWGSVYAGAGYAPLAVEQQYTGEGEMRTTLPATYHANGVHAFAGTRIWLKRTLERGFTINPELRVEKFGESTLISTTANIGIHF